MELEIQKTMWYGADDDEKFCTLQNHQNRI